MPKEYRIRVRIGGRMFGIVSDAKPDYLKEVAGDVDKSISQLLLENPGITFERAAVLSALKFCDDAKKSDISKHKKYVNTDEEDNLRRQVMEYSKELTMLLRENKSLEKNIQAMKEEYENKLCHLKDNKYN